MDYDTERAGGFEPLGFVPKGKQVILCIVPSKTGTLESKDQLKRRIEDASKFIDLDQLGLSANAVSLQRKTVIFSHMKNSGQSSA